MGPDSLRSPAERRHADGLLRTYVLSVRLTPAERVHVRAAAQAVGLSASQLARLRLLGHPLPRSRPVPAPRPEVNIETYRQLGAIGNNLNQLARHFNLRSGENPEAAEVLAQLHALIPLVRELQRRLCGLE
jgi:hypothetical protein